MTMVAICVTEPSMKRTAVAVRHCCPWQKAARAANSKQPVYVMQVEHDPLAWTSGTPAAGRRAILC